MRAVLGANVFVSALIKPSGPPGEIIRSLLDQGMFEIVVSTPILAEVRRTLGYPKVRRYLDASESEIEVWITAFAVVGLVVPGTQAVSVVAADPDDDIYVAAAVEGLADYLVSGDHHLLELGHFGDVKILSPSAFLAILREIS